MSSGYPRPFEFGILSLEEEETDLFDTESGSTSMFGYVESVITYDVHTGSVSERYLNEWRTHDRFVDGLNKTIPPLNSGAIPTKTAS